MSKPKKPHPFDRVLTSLEMIRYDLVKLITELDELYDRIKRLKKK